MQEVTESMGLPTLKERFFGPRDQDIVYWDVPVGQPKKKTRASLTITLRASDLVRLPKRCASMSR